MRKSMLAIVAHAEARMRAGRAILDNSGSDIDALVREAKALLAEKNLAMQEYTVHVMSHQTAEASSA